MPNASEQNIEEITALIKETITIPKDLPDALKKIEVLEKYANRYFTKAKDKRKAPNPGSTGYFLSYFWQIYNNQKWPILYTSLINAFKELNIWEEQKTQSATYEYFYNLNEEVKELLKSDLSEFIDKITWETPIKRFILLTSEALLHLLAYKFKDNLSPSEIINSIKSIDSVITAKEIIEQFDDF